MSPNWCICVMLLLTSILMSSGQVSLRKQVSGTEGRMITFLSTCPGTTVSLRCPAELLSNSTSKKDNGMRIHGAVFFGEDEPSSTRVEIPIYTPTVARRFLKRRAATTDRSKPTRCYDKHYTCSTPTAEQRVWPEVDPQLSLLFKAVMNECHGKEHCRLIMPKAHRVRARFGSCGLRYLAKIVIIFTCLVDSGIQSEDQGSTDSPTIQPVAKENTPKTPPETTINPLEPSIKKPLPSQRAGQETVKHDHGIDIHHYYHPEYKQTVEEQLPQSKVGWIVAATCASLLMLGMILTITVKQFRNKGSFDVLKGSKTFQSTKF